MNRVVVPPDERDDRLSVAFFHQPTYDAVIEPDTCHICF
jgi:isopenicillin N synthase-like dioxygenase